MSVCVRQRTDLTGEAADYVRCNKVSAVDFTLLGDLNRAHHKRISAFFFATVLASMLGCASTPQREGTGEYVGDSLITTKVKAAIFREPTLKVFQINVETFKGRVQLSGFVNSQDNIARTTEVASSVVGVTSITNDIRLC